MRIKNTLRWVIALTVFAVAVPSSHAVTVNPSGVNVKHSGATTVFLTFRGLANQVLREALWCGEINPNQSCVAGTIFGRLPVRSDLSKSSGTSNVTDIMTIPPSVARRAFQAAQSGSASQFFYVRRFASTTGGADEFVAVTCRLAGGGARVPLALLNVDLRFETDKQLLSVSQGNHPPTFNAVIQYNGTGRFKGRWEVVLPGDPQPTTTDLLTEATLPQEQRGTQKRYTQIGRFDLYLPPTGKIVLPGPDPAHLPTNSSGLHLILLRVEATDDKEGRSNVGAGDVIAGGVAGFPLPVLRYYVGKEDEANIGSVAAQADGVKLLEPLEGKLISPMERLNFSWLEFKRSLVYRLEVENEQGPVLSAMVESGVTSYSAPYWVQSTPGAMRWRILALGPNGVLLAQSKWNPFEIAPPLPPEEVPPAEVPADVPADVPAEVPADVPAEVPADVPAEGTTPAETANPQ